MAHYIAMSGFAGCLPDWTSGPCENRTEAIECAMHMFSDIIAPGDQAFGRALRIDSIVSLTGTDAGADYVEIVECDCKHPQHHEEC